jgi:feruloyl esterase
MKHHEASRQRQTHVITALRKSAPKSGALLAALLTSIAFGATPVAADTCSNLTANVKLRALPNTTITTATTVSGTFTPPDGTPALLGLPSFCRVAATLTPSPTSDIKVEVWLPTTGWNGRLQGVGNGGLAGSISYTAMAPAVEAGYASASTDTGHVASDLTWLTDPEREADNGYRAIHLTTVFAKDVIRQLYGGPVKYSYFNGCSTGGGQGVGEAQRYPDDYDGILAGALQIFATHLRAVDIWDFRRQTIIRPAISRRAP